MRTELTPSAKVDVCDACGGMWIDWFDGEVQTLAVETEHARVERGTLPPGLQTFGGAHGAAPSSAGKGSRACPRCMSPLIPDLYRFPDARDDELISGVELMRCAECAGSFVPRSSAHLLLERVREGRPSSIWEALVALVRRLFGRT